MSNAVITTLIIFVSASGLVNESELLSEKNSKDLKTFTKNFSRLCTNLDSNVAQRSDLHKRLSQAARSLAEWFEEELDEDNVSDEDIFNHLRSTLSPLNFEFITVGGDGVIFGAKDEGKNTVVKAIHPDELQSHSSELFVWLKAWNLNRDLVTELYECAFSYTIVYFIQEKMEGSLQNLAEREIWGKRFPISSLLDVMLKMSRCIAAVHSSGIVHYDIKLPNFLYSKQPSAGQDGKSDAISVKITDFGASNFLNGNSRGSTVVYRSPEVFITEKGDFSSDIFSLGVSFWRIIENEDEIIGKCDLYQINSDLEEIKTGDSDEDIAPLKQNISSCLSERALTMKASFERVKQMNESKSQAYDSLALLIEKMMSYEEKSRPTIDVVIDHLQALKIDQEKSSGQNLDII